MKASLALRLIGVSILVLVTNVVFSILYMVLYGHVINPGHDPKFYEDHIQVAGPYCSIFAGLPIMFGAGWWVAGWNNKVHSVLPAIIVWIAYTVIDLTILLVAGMSLGIGVLFVISFTTKLLAGYFGARHRLRHAK